MSRARSAIAARTTVETLFNAALKAFGKTLGDASDTFDDFFDAVTFCRPLTEELGGDEGSDGWYLWQVGEWAVLGDLGAKLQRDSSIVDTLSQDFDDLVVCALDSTYEYAHFSYYVKGSLKRSLILEDEVVDLVGVPVKAERGRMDDFTLEEADRLWMSYKLPTLELDPEEGNFLCKQVME